MHFWHQTSNAVVTSLSAAEEDLL